MLIQVTRNEGRTVAVKWDFYRAVADGLHEPTGLRREDVIICGPMAWAARRSFCPALPGRASPLATEPNTATR